MEVEALGSLEILEEVPTTTEEMVDQVVVLMELDLVMEIELEH